MQSLKRDSGKCSLSHFLVRYDVVYALQSRTWKRQKKTREGVDSTFSLSRIQPIPQASGLATLQLLFFVNQDRSLSQKKIWIKKVRCIFSITCRNTITEKSLRKILFNCEFKEEWAEHKPAHAPSLSFLCMQNTPTLGALAKPFPFNVLADCVLFSRDDKSGICKVPIDQYAILGNGSLQLSLSTLTARQASHHPQP